MNSPYFLERCQKLGSEELQQILRANPHLQSPLDLIILIDGLIAEVTVRLANDVANMDELRLKMNEAALEQYRLMREQVLLEFKDEIS